MFLNHARFKIKTNKNYINIDFDNDLFTFDARFDVTSVICTTSQGLKHGTRLRYRLKDKIGVCKKKNRSWVPSGERKIPTLGSTVPVGNSASLVSHWNGWTLGLGFSYLHWTPMMDSIYLTLVISPRSHPVFKCSFLTRLYRTSRNFVAKRTRHDDVKTFDFKMADAAIVAFFQVNSIKIKLRRITGCKKKNPSFV